MLFSMLVFLSQTIPASAQTPAFTNTYWLHPPAKRFFFASGPKDIGRPLVLAQPSQPARVVSRNADFAHLTFRPTILLPLKRQPTQDVRRPLKPKNTRLFFFNKP
jgi:hypothetical protein